MINDGVANRTLEDLAPIVDSSIPECMLNSSNLASSSDFTVGYSSNLMVVNAN
jgi:hypothetical protein